MLTQMVCAGFGGQGILTTGILIANGAFNSGKRITWYPSYGSEMRGGTANCSVIVSDEEIGSPVIYEPTDVVVMNEASMRKFEPRLKKGGRLFVNTSIIKEDATRDDIEELKIDSEAIAKEVGNLKVANMVMLGAIVRETGIVSMECVHKVIEKQFGKKRPEMIPMNLQALEAWQK